ncbi:MAG: hypothetical protein CMB95_06890 [Flavobacteriaceae bacterium]|nr:hypothetical protein [Flavobacteriaceae bacterium]|tara:strand:- start:6767 stop:7159 length:393 start_codon:yes stop_codon:yes gene_type:complete
MLENILWFLAGALVYRALSYTLGINAARKAALFAYDYAIIFLDAIDKDVNRAITLKHKALWGAGLSDEEMESVKQEDSKYLVTWRTKVLAKFIVGGPSLSFSSKNYLQSINPHDRLRKLKDNLDKLEVHK